MYRLTFRFMHEESVIQIDRLAVKMLFFLPARLSEWEGEPFILLARMWKSY